MWSNTVISNNYPKVNNRPRGENSSNPVTLTKNKVFVFFNGGGFAKPASI
jgi:hypothetical protein